LACQPPIGAPQAPLTTPLASGVSSQFDQQSQIAYLPESQKPRENTRPLQPISVGLEHTNSIAEPTLLQQEQGFTPYPGYIPPPPAPASMSGLPTLQGSAAMSGPSAGPIGVSSLGDVGNSIIPSSSDQTAMCPVELRFLSDFIACIQPQPFVPSNQESMRCNFEDGSFCRFVQP
ncbi:hypothetical protein COOONC_25883, partial [Cooperia oncophora]